MLSCFSKMALNAKSMKAPIGGLTYATLMTLFVVPCIYDILNKKELRNVREEDLKLLDI